MHRCVEGGRTMDDRERGSTYAEGVVARVRGRRAMVLVDGRFVRLRAVPGWDVGDQVFLRRGGRPSLWQGLSVTRRRLLVALAAAATAAVGTGSLLVTQVVAARQVVAVVSIDINPSVSLGVNAKGRVVQAVAMDGAGVRLLSQVSVRGLSVAEAIPDLVAGAVTDGYLAPSSSTAASWSSSTAGSGTGSRSSASSVNATTTTKTNGTVSATSSSAAVLVVVGPTGKSKVSSAVDAMVREGIDSARHDLQNSKVAAAVVGAETSNPQAVSDAHAEKVSLGRYMVGAGLSAQGHVVPEATLRSDTLPDVVRQGGAASAGVVNALRSAVQAGSSAVGDAASTSGGDTGQAGKGAPNDTGGSPTSQGSGTSSSSAGSPHGGGKDQGNGAKSRSIPGSQAQGAWSSSVSSSTASGGTLTSITLPIGGASTESGGATPNQGGSGHDTPASSSSHQASRDPFGSLLSLFGGSRGTDSGKAAKGSGDPPQNQAHDSRPQSGRGGKGGGFGLGG